MSGFIGGIFRNVWVKALILAGVAFVVYSNALGGPFVFDDGHVIAQNPSVRGPENIPSFFVDVSRFSVLVGNQLYRPVFLTSMALSWWAGDGSTLPFHLVSIALHAANAVLLFFILRRTFTAGLVASGGLPPAQSEWAAFLSAALFTVHPLATESIDYVSSQAVPLAVFFYLLSFNAFLTVYMRDLSIARSRPWLALGLSYGCYALALLSKTIAITLPLNLLLWDLILGRHRGPSTGSLWARYRPRLIKHLPYLAISVAYVALWRALINKPFDGGAGDRSFVVQYLTETKALVLYYLKLAVLPVGQNVDVEYPLTTSPLEPGFILAVTVIAVIGFLLYRFRQERNLVFWSVWFLTGLLLTGYVVFLGQVVNEHRVYLSLAGFCAVVGFLLFRFTLAVSTGPGEGPTAKRPGTIVTVALIGAVLINLGMATRARNDVWSSSLTLWEESALNGGKWRAHMNYALALEAEGRAEEALRQFETAVEKGPYAFAHLNLGHALVKRGDLKKGLPHLRTALRLWPSSPEVHYYLGYGLEKNGDTGEAEKEYRWAIKLRPRYLWAYRRLAGLQERQGNLSGANETWQKLQGLEPNDPGVSRRILNLESRMAPIHPK